MRRIVLTTFGSLGDLHPYLAVGLGLKARGNAVTIATSEIYRERVEREGLGFHAVRPDLELFRGDREVVRRVWSPQRGTEYIIRKLMLPHLADSFADLRAACRGADVLVTHVLLYAAPLVAETLGIPLVSVGLQPAAFVSVHDPSVLAPARWTYGLRRFGPTPFRLLHRLAAGRARAWAQPIYDLRRSLGLPMPTQNPILYWGAQGKYAQAWFSPLLGTAQPDWPKGTGVTGFPFYGASSGAALTAETEEFLHAGEPPLVFTLGSAAVQHAGDFYAESAAAARLLGRRAILLVGEEPLQGLASETIHVAAYEPYAALFPRAAAVVHQCGIGTTAESLRAGVPILAVPWGHDQFDNAERLKRLGCARVLSRRGYRARRVAKAIRELAGSVSIAAKVAEVAQRIEAEDGVAAACDAIEHTMQS